ncbi:MAG: hypothetical protein ACE14S_12545 [Candidatus Bathyarchaeia archaeon]
MKLAEIFREFGNGETAEELGKKRFACANCGVTWVELVGSVVVHRQGQEDLCLKMGMESDACQMCRMSPRKCQECGSSDVYELRFAQEVVQVPLSFKGIRTVNRE